MGDTPLTVGIFFTKGMSLAKWAESGLIDREIAYFQALGREVGLVRMFTYDTQPFSRSFAGIEICSQGRNRVGYAARAPIIHHHALASCDVIRTNQVSGAWAALWASAVHRKPLVVRLGYTPTLNSAVAGDSGAGFRARQARERWVLRAADRIFTTTERQRDYIVSRHRIDESKVRIVRNPIDIDRFAPKPTQAVTARDDVVVTYVGRFAPEKNLDRLIEACQKVPRVRLRLIGQGELAPMLHKLAGPETEFIPPVPNSALVPYLWDADIFALPSSYEGSPKALLEAMSCGRAVVGTDVPGIREVIETGKNGLLCTLDTLPDAIRALAESSALRAKLGSAARGHVSRLHAQTALAKLEASYLKEVIDAS